MQTGTETEMIRGPERLRTAEDGHPLILFCSSCTGCDILFS